MINIGYSIWEKTCLSIGKIHKNVLQRSLQWYPLSKLNSLQKQEISTEEFFNKYIKTGCYFLSNDFKNRFEYFLPKPDLNLRNVALINPIDLYYTIGLGFYLNSKYTDSRNSALFSVFSPTQNTYICLNPVNTTLTNLKGM